MNKNKPSSSRFGVSHTCPECKSEQLIKSGKTDNGKQRNLSFVNPIKNSKFALRIKDCC
jgi:hypothetical protein